MPVSMLVNTYMVLNMADKKIEANSTTGMKLAADILTKGGILVKEPCDDCNGVQVKFKNELRCVNCGRVKVISEQKEFTKKPNVTAINCSDSKEHVIRSQGNLLNLEIETICIARVKNRLLELINDIEKDEVKAEELTRAQLINTYLQILEKLSRVLSSNCTELSSP